MPGRQFNSDSYRYGFNGKENDNEVKGITGSQQDYGKRIYDPRLGRFLSVDPLTGKFAMLTPYQFASNRPIDGIDIDGLEHESYTITLSSQGKVIQTRNTSNDIKYLGEKGWGAQYTFKNEKGEVVGQYFVPNAPPAVWTGANRPLYVFGLKALGTYNSWESHYDPVNTGQTTKKDIAVGVGVIGVITGVGAIAEAVAAEGLAVTEGVATLNALDDALGGFTKGEGSALEDMNSKDLRATISATKGVVSLLTAIKTGRELSAEGKKAIEKTFSVLQVLEDDLNTVLKAKDAAEENEKKADQESQAKYIDSGSKE